MYPFLIIPGHFHSPVFTSFLIGNAGRMLQEDNNLRALGILKYVGANWSKYRKIIIQHPIGSLGLWTNRTIVLNSSTHPSVSYSSHLIQLLSLESARRVLITEEKGTDRLIA
jgi:hypothetical protein